MVKKFKRMIAGGLPSNSEYYMTEDQNGFWELRQKRFKAQLLKGNEHPHDVVAVNNSRRGLLEMYKENLRD
jgi:hypothetical protein